MAHLGLRPHGAPGTLIGLDLGCARDTWPTFDGMLAEHREVFPGWDLDLHTTLSYGNPSVAHPLEAPPTRAGGVCLWSQSVSTAQLSKGA